MRMVNGLEICIVLAEGQRGCFCA